MRSIFLCLFVSFFITGCLGHSMGSKSITPNPTYAGKILDKGKSFYVAVEQADPSSLSDTPAFIATQFSKFISPAARETLVASGTPNRAIALQEAKANESEYLLLLNIAEWRKHSIIRPGQKVVVDVTVIDTATEEILTQSSLKASCYVMVVGLEQSPRECIRPQADAWVQQTFQTTQSSAVHTDVKTFDMMRRGR